MNINISSLIQASACSSAPDFYNWLKAHEPHLTIDYSIISTAFYEFKKNASDSPSWTTKKVDRVEFKQREERVDEQKRVDFTKLLGPTLRKTTSKESGNVIFNFPSKADIIFYLKKHPSTNEGLFPYLTTLGIIEVIAERFANNSLEEMGILMAITIDLYHLQEKLQFPEHVLDVMARNIKSALMDCACEKK